MNESMLSNKHFWMIMWLLFFLVYVGIPRGKWVVTYFNFNSFLEYSHKSDNIQKYRQRLQKKFNIQETKIITILIFFKEWTNLFRKLSYVLEGISVWKVP